MVEGARLESVYTSKGYRGFESLPLCCNFYFLITKILITKLIIFGLFGLGFFLIGFIAKPFLDPIMTKIAKRVEESKVTE